MSGFQLQRLGMIMEPEPGNTLEAEGVLNPAVVRGPDGHPRKIIYRSAEPVLTPVLREERNGISGVPRSSRRSMPVGNTTFGTPSGAPADGDGPKTGRQE